MTVYRGRRVAVWGAARSGIAAANLLSELGARVTLSDGRSESDLELDHLDTRVRFVGGGNTYEGAEILVPSPGIRPSVPLLQAALTDGVTLVSEIELAASVARAPVVAITGTDGKSTTTVMMGAVVEAAGRESIVAGNIGIPFSERVLDAREDDVLVIEVSAFQLWSCGTFKPDVAIVTNIADDHAEYFEGDTEAYIASKARLLVDMESGSTAVLRLDDPIVREFPIPDGVERTWFQPSSTPRGWGFESGQLTRNGQPILSASDLRVPGLHNVSNALSALAAGDALGLDSKAMQSGLKSFGGLPHRLEHVRERRGVDWFDDSKATNPHAAAAGIKALSKPLVVITGGYDKGLNLAPFIDALDHPRHIICTGPTASRTMDAIEGRWAVTRATDMADAVVQAAQIAQYGDAIILSPAASSFDAYRSYAHRGEVFQDAVKSLPE